MPCQGNPAAAFFCPWGCPVPCFSLLTFPPTCPTFPLQTDRQSNRSHLQFWTPMNDPSTMSFGRYDAPPDGFDEMWGTDGPGLAAGPHSADHPRRRLGNHRKRVDPAGPASGPDPRRPLRPPGADSKRVLPLSNTPISPLIWATPWSRERI